MTRSEIIAGLNKNLDEGREIKKAWEDLTAAVENRQIPEGEIIDRICDLMCRDKEWKKTRMILVAASYGW